MQAANTIGSETSASDSLLERFHVLLIVLVDPQLLFHHFLATRLKSAAQLQSRIHRTSSANDGAAAAMAPMA